MLRMNCCPCNDHLFRTGKLAQIAAAACAYAPDMVNSMCVSEWLPTMCPHHTCPTICTPNARPIGENSAKLLQQLKRISCTSTRSMIGIIAHVRLVAACLSHIVIRLQTVVHW